MEIYLNILQVITKGFTWEQILDRPWLISFANNYREV